MEEKEKKKYLKNKELLAELAVCFEKGHVTNRMGTMFMLLAERYTRHRYFSRYEFKDDLISVGVLACMNAWQRFDIDNYSNPFAYFTTTIHNGFVQYLKKHYDQSNVKNELKLQAGLDPEMGYNEMKQEQSDKEAEEEKAITAAEQDDTDSHSLDGEPFDEENFHYDLPETDDEQNTRRNDQD